MGVALVCIVTDLWHGVPLPWSSDTSSWLLLEGLEGGSVLLLAQLVLLVGGQVRVRRDNGWELARAFRCVLSLRMYPLVV